MTRRPPSQSAEDYLERIFELIQEKGVARVADIATSLKVRQASVTDMVQKLARQGYLKYERYQDVVMTNKGRDVARKIQNRHKTLSRFFSLLGLDAATQREDIEGIEHHLSRTTVNVLSDLVLFFEKHPQTLKSFLQSRNGGRNVKRKL
jgi:Mn-dependent DtxR family transcriptional regulator